LALQDNLTAPAADNEIRPEERGGCLDGRVIFRFAHAFESGGGTERYLEDLDGVLLGRNAATVIRMHLTRDCSPKGETEATVGKGRLIRVPLPILPANDAAPARHSPGLRLKQIARDWILYNPLVWRAVGARCAASYRLQPEPGQADGAGRAAAEIFRSHRVDLVVLHFFGGFDAGEVLAEARKARVPVAILNHFSNDRFLHLAIRKHAMLANGVAGVNGLDVPTYLRDRFTNLSDGIDTHFFQCANARPLQNAPAEPIVLLPARVTREKGQMDLVRAVALLRKSGIVCSVVFAGRADDAGFIDELRRETAKAGLGESVRFLGNISIEDLRDWYAASTVVAYPTYHHEGVPRGILESQAMGVPVVAYASGGIAEGILPGKSGFLLPPGDIQGLTMRLREILSSPPMRISLGSCGRLEIEKRFSLPALADRHEQFYVKTISDFHSTAVPVN
jgi:glycosyltransferase involved in cell wall biosynthesis